jgi:hypothetical protein
MSGIFCLNADLHVTFRDLLHAVKLRHVADGFTFPQEGVLNMFFALKIRRLRPGANPRTWVPKASTLPLDHRSRLLQRMVYRPSCILVIENCTQIIYVNFLKPSSTASLFNVDPSLNKHIHSYHDIRFFANFPNFLSMQYFLRVLCFLEIIYTKAFPSRESATP